MFFIMGITSSRYLEFRLSIFVYYTQGKKYGYRNIRGSAKEEPLRSFGVAMPPFPPGLSYLSIY
jgi:hypothetical protein